jgi:hypothetical protein
MNAFGNIAAILVLICMIIQDFRSRTISAWLLPAIVVCLIIPPLATQEFRNLIFPNFIYNVILLSAQFVLLWIIISFRNRKWINIINTQIGIGDVLLLLCLTPFFSPLNYFVLFTVAIVFSLIVAILMKATSNKATEYIPFAGLFSVPLILLCVLRLLFPAQISFSSDAWLNNYVL